MDNVRRHIRLVAASALVAITVCGCTMWDPTLVSPPPVSESPEPTPSAAPPVDAPTPRISAGCDDLISLEILKGTLTNDVALDPERSRARSPEFAAVEQLGALTCLWENRVPPPPWEDQDPGHSSALLHVLPDAEEPWKRFSRTYGPVSGPSPYGESAIGPNCNGAEPDMPGPPMHRCQLDALVGSYWVQLSLTGVSGGSAESNDELLALAREVTDPLLAAVASESPPAPRWTPPAHQPLDCETIMTDEQAMSVTGVGNLGVGQHLDGPKVGQFLYSLEQTGAKRCHLLIVGSDNSVAHIAFLPGGGWAFRDRFDAWMETGDAVHTDLEGARAGEEFTEECAKAEEDCRIDMLIGENWIQVLTYAYVPGKISQPDGVDMLEIRSKTQEIAETVLANLHARGKTG